MRWRFDRSSFLISIIIFFIEVLIAKFVDDAFIRPYGGDILVVIGKNEQINKVEERG